jgi:pilus assembly protein CpaF
MQETHSRGRELEVSIRVAGAEAKKLELRQGDVAWIGRSSACQVVLPSSAVSRRHVALSCQKDKLVVSDASHNGTSVDGALLKRASRILSEGRATLHIGSFEIEIERRFRVERTQAPESPLGQEASSDPEPRGTPEQQLSPATPALRRRVHRLLLDHLELPKLDRHRMDADQMRPRVVAGLWRIVGELAGELSADLDKQALVQELSDEALGLGPLERLLHDVDVSEIMVVDPHSIYVERRGRIEYTGLRFTDDESVRAVIERIVTPLGRRIDESNPLVDARLPDGSRVNAVIPPLAIKGPCITIRKFSKDPLEMSDLVGFGSLDQRMARFLERSVRVRKNIVIAGGTGSGKTTLLNVLSAAIPESERLVTIEDAAELNLRQPHVVSLESRPANLEGKGEYTIRDLLRNALRMRPDRIIVGECRGPETIDMLQAMNTGHEGSMTTTHANSPREALTRIETLCLMAGIDLPVRAIRTQIAASVHLVVQQSRLGDGSRRILSIAEVTGLDDDGELELAEIFSFERSGTSPDGKVLGEFRRTGYLPSFIDQFLAHGIAEGDDPL